METKKVTTLTTECGDKIELSNENGNIKITVGCYKCKFTFKEMAYFAKELGGIMLTSLEDDKEAEKARVAAMSKEEKVEYIQDKVKKFMEEINEVGICNVTSKLFDGDEEVTDEEVDDEEEENGGTLFTEEEDAILAEEAKKFETALADKGIMLVNYSAIPFAKAKEMTGKDFSKKSSEEPSDEE